MNETLKYPLMKLKDFAYFQEGPGIRNHQNTETGIRFLNIRCFVNGRLDTASMKKVSEEEAYGKYRHFLLDAGDFVVSSSGTLGRVAEVYPQDLPVMLNTSTIRFKPLDSSKLDRLYLRYFLESELFQQQVKSLATGSVQLNYGPSHLAFVEIPIPPIETQKAIGEVLENITQKITINGEISESLEEMIQLVFKSWFINQERNKIDNFKWGAISDIADIIDCLHAKKPELMAEGFPYLQLDTISDSGVLNYEKSAKISQEDYAKWTSRIEIKGGDCLITNVGRVGAVSQVPNHFKGAIGRNITAIRPKNKDLYETFLITALLSDFMKSEIKRNTDSGTILEALNVKNIPKLRIPLPSDEVLTDFENLCGPMRQQINLLYRETVELKKLRDSLLPRLITGALPIPEEMLAS